MSERGQSAEVNDELSLMEILGELAQYKKLFLAATIVGSVISLAIATQLQPVWEASAFIRVGQDGQQLIEPLPRTVARLKSPVFIRSLFRRYGKESKPKLLEQSFYKSFSAKPLLDTDLIEIKFRAASSEMAKILILTTVNQLRTAHDAMVEPGANLMKRQIVEIEKNLQEEKKFLRELEQKLTASKGNYAASMLYFTLYQQKIREIREMEQKKITLEEQMLPTHIFPTNLVGEIYVSNEPVSPKKWLLTFLGTVAGFLGTVFVVLLRNLFRNVKY